MFFSKTTNGFYDAKINTTMPDDVVEITRDDYLKLLEDQAAGKSISSDKNGLPITKDRAAMTNNEKIFWEIYELEKQQTPRRIREAIIDPSWMISIDNQIAALRKKLK